MSGVYVLRRELFLQVWFKYEGVENLFYKLLLAGRELLHLAELREQLMVADGVGV